MRSCQTMLFGAPFASPMRPPTLSSADVGCLRRNVAVEPSRERKFRFLRWPKSYCIAVGFHLGNDEQLAAFVSSYCTFPA